MSRKPPDTPPPVSFSSSDRKLFELNLKVITPMFGGSAEAGVVDPVRPVSAKSIRGHLRFWWRACMAGKFNSPAQLFEAEELIWGSTDTPSAVDVDVSVISPGREIACAHFRNNRNGVYGGVPQFNSDCPGYALFPFQGERPGGGGPDLPTALAREGVEFRLTIRRSGSAPTGEMAGTLESEIRPALWAWIVFGGIGARTRRGCGSLWCKSGWVFDKWPTGKEDLVAQWASFGLTELPAKLSFPAIKSSSIVLGTGKLEANRAWCTAVNLMREFRQGDHVGRTPVQGRSLWPEPDSIRRVTTHKREHPPEHQAEDYYPRADLGMPIIIQFKRDDMRDGDPDPHTLQGGGAQQRRMASPIITKAFPISETQAVPLLVQLNAPHVWDEASPGVKLNNTPLSVRQLSDKGKSALVQPLNNEGMTSARTAFMKFAKGRLGGAEGANL